MKLLESYQFHDPWILWTLLILPLFILLYIWKTSKSRGVLKTSSITLIEGIDNKKIEWLRHGFFGLKLIAFSALIIGLARPQIPIESESYVEISKQGIEIIISLDASGSMLAKDFSPDRFEASKILASDFVKNRPNDKIGLVIFEGEAYTQCPLTTDINILTELIDEAEQGIVEQGTAIGMGLATAVNRLRESKSPSKVIILLTDGVNTHGKIHPLNAAEMAKQLGIRVYTIGVGTNGKAKTPVAIDPYSGNYIYDYIKVEIDEGTLTKIADETGGKYFRATNNKKLKEIYKEIDELETAKINTIEYEIDLPEKASSFILFAFSVLALEFILKNIFMKSIQ